MKLIDDWRHAWRFWSVRLNALGLLCIIGEQALPLWGFVPAEARAVLPAWLTAGLPILCFALATAARVLRQDAVHSGSDDAGREPAQ